MLTDEEFKRFLRALGTRIKTLRKDKNFNMRDIMIATGYYDTQWRKYEAGGSMNLQSLMKVAMALDVSLAELFDGLAEWPKRSVFEIETLKEFKAGKGRPNPEADPLLPPVVVPDKASRSTKSQLTTLSKLKTEVASVKASKSSKTTK